MFGIIFLTNCFFLKQFLNNTVLEVLAGRNHSICQLQCFVHINKFTYIFYIILYYFCIKPTAMFDFFL